MRIYINGRFLAQKTTGIQRFAREITLALDRMMIAGVLDRDVTVSLLAPKNAELDLDVHRIDCRRVGRLTGHAWDQFDLPRFAGGGVLLSFASTGPVVKRRQLIAIHDAAIYANPKNFSSAYRMLHKLLGPVFVRVAGRILTVSSFSIDELSRYLSAANDRFAVIYNSGEHIRRSVPDEGILDRHGLRSKRYILCFGSGSPNKNIGALVEALPHVAADVRLVAVGSPRSAVFGPLQARGDDRLVLAGFVDDGKLRALYEHAAAFIFPSIYEGAGIPPLEAMALGCPVVVSSTSAMPEICGDAAIYIDPDDPLEIAASIERLLRDDALCAEMRARGLERAARFTWEGAARRVMREVETLYAPADGTSRILTPT